jgi:hypothetical protein
LCDKNATTVRVFPWPARPGQKFTYINTREIMAAEASERLYRSDPCWHPHTPILCSDRFISVRLFSLFHSDGPWPGCLFITHTLHFRCAFISRTQNSGADRPRESLASSCFSPLPHTRHFTYIHRKAAHAHIPSSDNYWLSAASCTWTPFLYIFCMAWRAQ